MHSSTRRLAPALAALAPILALLLVLGCDPGTGSSHVDAAAPGNEGGAALAAAGPAATAQDPHDHGDDEPAPTPPPGVRRPTPQAAPAEPPTGPQPRIVFGNKKHDFKTVVFGDVVEHKFAFENQGDADLQIERVQPSCGCVAAPLEKKTYKPGEKGEIAVTFDTSKKTPNFHRLTISVYSNDWHEKDRNTYVSLLEISGDVIVFFKTLPMQYVFSNIARGAPATSVATIYSTGESGEVLEVDRVEVSNPKTMQAQLIKPSPKAGTGNFGPDAVDVRLTVTPDRIGTLIGKVTLHTKSERQPEVVIDVRGTITGDITVDRKIIYVSNYIKGRQLVPNQFRITRRPGTPLKILGIETTEGLIAVPKEFTKDRIYMIDLALDSKLPPRPFAGEVKVYVNSEDQPMIQVPVVVYMQPSISVNPDSIYFERKRSEGPYSKLITVIPPHGYPMELSLAGEMKSFDVEVRPPAEKGRPGHVIVKSKVDLPAGPVAEDLVLTTNVLGEERLVIPIRATILE